MTMIAVVADTVDEVGNRTVPGAFTRSLCVHTPKVCLGHQWNVPIGRVLSVKQLLPVTRGCRAPPAASGRDPRREEITTDLTSREKQTDMIDTRGRSGPSNVGKQ
jgi:hypothetical protein